MRRFELILVFVSVFAVLWPAVFGVRPKRGIAAGILITAIVAQLQVEGFRWQMIPVYLLATGLAVGDILFIDRQVKWSSRLARATAGLAGVLASALLAVVLPVPVLPLPSGPESIGTVSLEIVDEERVEAYGPDPGGPRRFMAQVWYPAVPDDDDEPVVWSEDWDVVAPAVSAELGLPSWFLDYTRYTDSHSHAAPRVADGTFPLIIYSHGWTGFRTIAVNQIENLVSNGYMVIAPDHTYGAVATELSDGAVIPYDPAMLPDEEEVGVDAYLEAGESLIFTFAADLMAIIDGLEAGDSGPFGELAVSADLTRIGIYGHSAGGAAAIKVCLEDERCDAVLGLDPWVEPLPDRVIRETVTRPSLYMRSDGARGTENDALLRGIAGRSVAVTYWLGVEGADHSDFVMTPLLTPFASQVGLKGPIPAGRIIPILDNYLLGFFDVFLLGTGPAALDDVSFEEVSVEVLEP